MPILISGIVWIILVVVLILLLLGFFGRESCLAIRC